MKEQTSHALDFAHHFINTLPTNSAFDVFTTLQRLTSLQLGIILYKFRRRGIHQRLTDVYGFFLLYVHVSGIWPKAVMRLPVYKKQKRVR